jgi:hypothetical protein
MSRVKDIVLKPISRRDADRVVKTLHYSGRVVRNSQLHFGVFLDGRCGGALQFGPSLDKSKLIHLVENTRWNEFLELNRMALADWLPRNSESRAVAVACRLIKRHYPFVRWIISFADGCQSGSGVIYRGAGFLLTQIAENQNLVRLPSGEVVHKVTLESSPNVPRPELGGRSYFGVTGGVYDLGRYIEVTGGERMKGYQYRYIKLLDPAARLTCAVLPYSEIDKVGRSVVG